MWETETEGELVLAHLCLRCTSNADRLLDVYGGRGRASLRVAGPSREAAMPLRVLRRTTGATVRAAFYVLIALATFFIVTLITTRQ
jgi:hypothetical protein